MEIRVKWYGAWARDRAWRSNNQSRHLCASFSTPSICAVPSISNSHTIDFRILAKCVAPLFPSMFS